MKTAPATTGLRAWTEDVFGITSPMEFRWSGREMRTRDGLALIGRDPRKRGNVFMTSGGCGAGSSQSAVAGLLIRDLVLGRGNPWASLYAPDRPTLQAPGTQKKRLGGGVVPTAQWLAPRLDESSAIPLGCGAILDRGASKVAVYRDENGELQSARPSAPTWGASWPGIMRRRLGTAPAVAHVSTLSEWSCEVQPAGTSSARDQSLAELITL